MADDLRQPMDLKERAERIADRILANGPATKDQLVSLLLPEVREVQAEQRRQDAAIAKSMIGATRHEIAEAIEGGQAGATSGPQENVRARAGRVAEAVNNSCVVDDQLERAQSLIEAALREAMAEQRRQTLRELADRFNEDMRASWTREEVRDFLLAQIERGQP